QLVNKEALPFPTGTATAETLRSIHGSAAVSSREEPVPTAQEADAYRAASEDLALKPARALAWAAGVGTTVTVLRDIVKVLPGQLALPFSISGHSLAQWTLAF